MTRKVLVQSKTHVILHVSLSLTKTAVTLREKWEIFYKCAILCKLLNHIVAKDKMVSPMCQGSP